jgi:hypothetical protein
LNRKEVQQELILHLKCLRLKNRSQIYQDHTVFFLAG